MIVEDPSLTLQCICHSEYLLGICIVQPEGSMHHQTSQSAVLVHQILWSQAATLQTRIVQLRNRANFAVFYVASEPRDRDLLNARSSVC